MTKPHNQQMSRDRRNRQLRRQRRLDNLGVPKDKRLTAAEPNTFAAYIDYLRRLQRYTARREPN